MQDYSDPDYDWSEDPAFKMANEDNPYAGGDLAAADAADLDSLSGFESLIGESLGKGTDGGLLKTISSFLGQNKELSSMLLQGFGSAMQKESALQLYNRMNDDKLDAQKRYNDSVKGATPNSMGLIGSNMIKSIRGQG